MKNFILFFAITALLISCGGEKAPETVEEKEKAVVEHRKKIAELSQQIATWEAEIKEAKGKNPEDDYRTVEFINLASTTFQHFVEVQGNVESDKNVQVFPKTQGTILSLKATEGQQVSAGQVIAEIDAAQMRKVVAELEKKLELAKIVFDRQSNLWKQKIGSEIQYLQAKNNYESLQKSIETQQEMLSNAIVRAPISGVLDEYMQNAGEMANPAMPIARIVNLSTVEVNAEVSEAYTKSVKRGDEVQVAFPAIDTEMPVHISQIGQTINPKNRTFRISLKVPNKEGYLKPNAMAVVKIKDFERENAISVPSHVLQQSTSGERFVYVVNEKDGNYQTEKRVVELGQTYKGKTLITSGLKTGDKLVVKGYNEIIDAEAVKGIKNEE